MLLNYRTMQAWSAVAGVIVAVSAFLIAWSSYSSTLSESRNKTTIDAMLEWSRRQPVNANQCLRLMEWLEKDQIKEIVARRPVSVSPNIKGEVRACFSDNDSAELAKLFDSEGSILSPKGASLFASRISRALNADSFLASLIIDGVGNAKMLRRRAAFICKDDKAIGRLPDIDELKDSFSALRQILKMREPTGCAKSGK